MADQFVFRYVLELQDRASAATARAQAQIRGQVAQTGRVMTQQAATARQASGKVTEATARQAAEWKQVARAAGRAEREVAQSTLAQAAAVDRSTVRQVQALRRQGASYSEIARQQKAAGASAAQTAAAIEQSAAKERAAIESTATAAHRSGGKLSGGLKSQLSSVKGMAGGLAAGFAAFKGLSFIEDAIQKTEGLARATVKLQAITGMDTRTASHWVSVAKQRGLEAKQLNQAFITLEKSQVKASQGSKLQTEAFRKLGISQEQLKKLKTEQLVERVSDGFKKLGPGAQRAAIAQALFARGGQLLIGVLSKGGAALREQLRASASMSTKGVNDSLKFVAAQRRLNNELTKVQITIGQALIPYLTKGATAVGKFIDQMRNGTGPGGAFARALKTAADGAKSVWTAIQPAVKALASFVRQHPGIVKVAGGIAAVGLAVKALRFAGAISGVNSLLKVLGVLSRTKAGSLAARAIIGALSPLGKMLAGPLATAKRVLVSTLAGAGEDAGAAAVGGIRGKLGRMRLPRPTGLFRAFGTAMGIAAGAALVGQISKALDNLAFGNSKTRRSGGGSSGSSKIDDLLPLGDVTHAIQNFLGLRRGGRIGYQAGGVVPAMVSPGEMIVHQGRAGMVPGAPVAADNVAMMLPVGAAVLTGDGQRMVSQGATIGEAIARQAPHFAGGGWVRTGATVFSDPPPGAFGSLAGGYAELGTATRGGAGTGRGWIARALGRKGELPPNYPLDVKIRGRTKRLRKRDRGYGQGTPAFSIDIWRDSWPAFGIDSTFKGPALIRPASGAVSGGAARAATSTRVSGYAAALARRVAPSRVRAGILSDAFDQGVAQGEAGMTRARLRSMGDPVYRAISASYRVPGDKIVRVAGRAAPGGSVGGGGGRGGVLTRGIRAAANSIAKRWNVNGRVAEIAALAMQAFPGVSVSSGFRPGAITKNGNPSNHGFHRALDLAATGRRNLALGAWLRRRFPPSFRGVTEGIFDAQHDPTGQHGTHVHVAAAGGFFNRYRRGGIARFQTGGRVPRYTYATPGERGTTIRGDEFGVYGQPSRGMGGTLGGAMFPVVRASKQTFAKRFAALNAAIQNAAADKIAALRRGLLSAVRRGGSELAVKRMQQAIDLIDYEFGRRIGLLSRRIAARTAVAEQRVTRTDIGLRISGVDPESAQGITARLGAERGRGDALHRTARDLDKQLRLAEKDRDLQKISEIRQGIADNQTAILESRANQAELARARAEAQKSARLAFAQGLTDIAGSRTSLAQVGLQGIELTQRLAGTYDTGGQARADYIRSAIIPDLQAEQAGIRAQGIEAMRQNNADLARQLTQAYAEKQNEILQAQLDAQEATAKNTEETTDALKQLGGTLGFEFGGARFTDALVASGVGA